MIDEAARSRSGRQIDATSNLSLNDPDILHNDARPRFKFFYNLFYNFYATDKNINTWISAKHKKISEKYPFTYRLRKMTGQVNYLNVNVIRKKFDFERCLGDDFQVKNLKNVINIVHISAIAQCIVTNFIYFNLNFHEIRQQQYEGFQRLYRYSSFWRFSNCTVPTLFHGLTNIP